MPKLTIVTGTDFSTKFSISQPVVRLGRSDENDIVLDDVSVSRHHARLVEQAAGYVLEDLGSRAGTLVNGRRVQRQLLGDGDEIEVGRFTLVYQEDYEGLMPLGLTMVDETPRAEPASPAPDPRASSPAGEPLLGPGTGLQASAPPGPTDGAPSDRGDRIFLTDELRALSEPALTDTDPLRNVGLSEPVPQPLVDPAKLIIVHKGTVVREEALMGYDLSIGRDENNDIVLEAIEVSRFHAKITHDGRDFVIEDLGSSNGVILNGEAVERARLRHADEIQIGSFTLLFRQQPHREPDDDSFDDSSDLFGTDPEIPAPAPVERSDTFDHLAAGEGDASSEATLIEGAAFNPFLAPTEGDEPDTLSGSDRQDDPDAMVLIVVDGPEAGKRFVLSGAQVSIGRDEGADVSLQDDSVSRAHALITRTPLHYEVQDLGSTNGTRVNDEVVDRAILKAGDYVGIGNITLLVMLPESHANPSVPQRRSAAVRVKRRSPLVPLAIVTVTAALMAIALVVASRRPAMPRGNTGHRPTPTVVPTATDLPPDVEDVPQGPFRPAPIEATPKRPTPPPPRPRPTKRAAPTTGRLGDLSAQAAASYDAALAAYGARGPAAAMDVIEEAIDLPIPREDPNIERALELQRVLRALGESIAAGGAALQAGDLDGAAAAWYGALDRERIAFPRDYHFLARTLAPKLAEVEVRRGDAAQQADQTALAYERYRAALQLSPGEPKAVAQIQAIDRKVKRLYRDAYIYADPDPNRARAGFEAVLRMVPPDHEYHRKAQEQLNRLR